MKKKIREAKILNVSNEKIINITRLELVVNFNCLPFKNVKVCMKYTMFVFICKLLLNLLVL